MRESRRATADLTKKLTLETLGKWKRVCRRQRPLAAFLFRKFDSAKTTLTADATLPGVGKVRRTTAKRSVDMIVSKRELILVFPTRTVEIAIPSLPVASDGTNVNATHQALDKSDQII